MSSATTAPTRRGFLVSALGAGLVMPTGRELCPLLAASAGVPQPALASHRSGRRFIDSVGINSHWGYTDTPYAQAWPQLFDLLVASGIQHVRGTTERASALIRRGVRSTALIDLAPDGSGSPRDGVMGLRSLILQGAVVAVEGPNEPDLFWSRANRTFDGLTYRRGVPQWQRELFAAARGVARRSKLQVFGPALGDHYWGRPGPFAANSLEPFVDYGNFHPYPRDNPFTLPTPYAGVARYYWDTDFPSSTLDRYPIALRTARVPYGSKPMVATETGYSTWVQGVSEEVHGYYIARILLENFRIGIRRTYLYELIDEFDDPDRSDKESNFGLIRHDLTTKPAYSAVRSLLWAARMTDVRAQALINVESETVAPSGYDQRYVHRLLLSRGGGSYVLFIWHEIAGETTFGAEGSPRRRLIHPVMPTRLRLPEGYRAGPIEVIDATGTLVSHPAAAARGQTVEVAVDERVTAIQITSGSLSPQLT